MESRQLLSSSRSFYRAFSFSSAALHASPRSKTAPPSSTRWMSNTSPFAPYSSTASSSPVLCRTLHRQQPSLPRRAGPPSARLQQQQQQRRTLISAPRPDSGPIMERRPDRELPDIRAPLRRWLKTLPVFVAICAASALAIFNYEKSSSSVVAATLYSLRTHPRARQLLGDEVYFRDRLPWIWGELNQVRGRIDIGYGVKGTRASGFMRFKAVRRSRQSVFETVDWTLELEDGTVIKLLEDGQGRDPYSKEAQVAEKQ